MNIEQKLADQEAFYKKSAIVEAYLREVRPEDVSGFQHEYWETRARDGRTDDFLLIGDPPYWSEAVRHFDPTGKIKLTNEDLNDFSEEIGLKEKMKKHPTFTAEFKDAFSPLAIIKNRIPHVLFGKLEKEQVNAVLKDTFKRVVENITGKREARMGHKEMCNIFDRAMGGSQSLVGLKQERHGTIIGDCGNEFEVRVKPMGDGKSATITVTLDGQLHTPILDGKPYPSEIRVKDQMRKDIDEPPLIDVVVTGFHVNGLKARQDAILPNGTTKKGPNPTYDEPVYNDTNVRETMENFIEDLEAADSGAEIKINRDEFKTPTLNQTI